MKIHVALKPWACLTLALAVFNACTRSVAPGGPDISLEPRSGNPGALVTVTGSGFPPGIELNVRLGPPSIGATPQSYATALADEQGRFTLTFEMPERWPDETPISAQELLVVVLNQDATVKATAPFDFTP